MYVIFIANSSFLANISFSNQEIKILNVKILNESTIGEHCVYRKYDGPSFTSKLKEDITCVIPSKENKNVRIILNCRHSTFFETKRISKLSLRERIFGNKKASWYARNLIEGDYIRVEKPHYFYNIVFSVSDFSYKDSFQEKDYYRISLSSSFLKEKLLEVNRVSRPKTIKFELPKHFGDNIFNGSLIDMAVAMDYHNYWLDTSEVISIKNYSFELNDGDQVRKVLSKLCYGEEELKRHLD